jgi:hypothetical protein
MATITRPDGQVIAWGGQVDGPKTVYSEMGTPRTMSMYSAELGVGDAELRPITVYVTELAKMAIGSSTSEREDMVKRCVGLFIEKKCRDSWVPKADEHFSISGEEIASLREEVLKAA